MIRLGLAAGLIALVALLAAAAPARASSTQESTFQDDNRLLYAEPAAVRRTLDELERLGVDRLRATVLWKAVAPQPGSRARPAFDAADPASYPPGSFNRYDVLVAEAAVRGLKVNFNVTGPAPLWATKPAPRDDIADTFEPSPREFGQFVTALGRRYSGQWPAGEHPQPTSTIQRVDYWSIWNEPNHSGWLTPQWSRDGGGFERAASLYRELAGAAYGALVATGHGQDTILVGETAPKGDRSKGIKRYMEAMTFVRALYCVNRRLRPLQGARARTLDCPANPRNFREQNPALFAATGYAHHPYDLLLPPRFKHPRANWVTLANLPRLTRTLDRIFRRYGSNRRLPLYLTEYGYQTNPPDPLGVSWRRQAAYLNQAEYMSFRNPRVRTLSQFLLEDDDPRIAASFQSGLRSRSGKKKPAYRAYRLPVWLPRSSVRSGRSAKVWALLRTAENGKPARAVVEHKPRGAKRYKRLKSVSTRNSRGYVQTRIRVRRSGRVRVRLGKVTSRAAPLRVRR